MHTGDGQFLLSIMKRRLEEAEKKPAAEEGAGAIVGKAPAAKKVKLTLLAQLVVHLEEAQPPVREVEPKRLSLFALKKLLATSRGLDFSKTADANELKAALAQGMEQNLIARESASFFPTSHFGYRAGSSSAAAGTAPYSMQALVLAFASSGSSVRQREASLAGLLPPEMHTLILKQLPVTYYASITGVVGTVGNGIGTWPGQFKTGNSLRQVSFGPDSTVWATDCWGDRVHHFKQSGELIKTIGTGDEKDSAAVRRRQWGQPSGVAVSRLGSSVFISAYGKYIVSEFNQSDGAFVRVLESNVPGRGEVPYGMHICLSPDETTLAIPCFRNAGHCIKLIAVDGSVAPWTIGEEGSGDGQFNTPLDVRFTPDGQQLVVADHGNNRVQCLALDGSFVRKMPLGAAPFAVAVDAAGNIIATTENHVKVFSPEGTLLHDRLGGLEMDFAAFSGLAIDPSSGRIAVGDRGAGKVHLL